MIVRYLELESSGRRNEIRFIYTAMDARNNPVQHTESFSYTLADSKWHKVSLTVSGSEIQLLVDCHLIYRRMADHIPDRNFSASEMHLFVGQRDNQYQLKVSIKYCNQKIFVFQFKEKYALPAIIIINFRDLFRMHILFLDRTVILNSVQIWRLNVQRADNLVFLRKQ